VVSNQPANKWVSVCEFYEQELGFYGFRSVDDKQINTEYSALRSVVMTSYEEKVRLKILVDYAENGYLLQIFSIPVQDSPTVFFRNYSMS
jgi:4-hydroxyphenylpyruvate dioxygenase-like putative hemolysin